MNLLVVNYHYYGEKVFKSGIYPISHTKFIEQIEIIGKDFDFISPHSLSYCFYKGEFPTGNFCLITFDDGLKQQIHANEILSKLNIAAAFYVSVKPLVEQKVLDVHKIQFIRTEMSDFDLSIELRNTYDYQYTLNDLMAASKQYKYDSDVAREVKFQLNFKLTANERDQFITKTFARLFGNEKSFASKLYMDEKDLKYLALNNQIGSHGYAHVPLANYSNAEFDIRKSLHYLSKITNSPIQSFSYPYGSTEAVNSNVAQIVKDCGFAFALTMWRGVNSIDDSSNPFLLKRIDTNDVPRDGFDNSQYILLN